MALTLSHMARRARRTGTALVVVVVAVALSGALAVGYLVRELTGGPRPEVCRVVADGATFEFTPTQLNNAATIAAVGQKRDLPVRAIQLAQATALVETGLRNLDYGDRDSVGLFQQRPSQGWGTVEQIMDPVYSSTRFYQALVKVRDWETRRFTEVAQAVQRSAYPERYGEHEASAAALAKGFAGLPSSTVACRTNGQPAAGDPSAVVAALKRELGVTGESAGRTVVVDAGSTGTARAVAAWAVGRAESLGVTAVEHAGSRWTRGPEGLDWKSTSPGPEDRVTIRFD